MDLKDKVVVITGATKGLGAALAELFSKEGCKVVASATTKQKLDDLAGSLNCYAVQADVRREEQMLELADQTVKRFGHIDIWVNNAGIRIPHTNLEEIDWDRAHNMLEVNYFGTAYGTKAALKYMKERGSGTIINILSTSALQGRAKSSAYAASKYAARGFTESIRSEVKGDGIAVIGVYPGGMKTDFFKEQVPEDYDKYMDASTVGIKIIDNLKLDKPEEEQVIRRPAV
ncbi:MAG: SDR family oxidoreductase [Candidatus Micrarchaeota archaeon]|nr:SDR family oxidoreductase [Candidatus Micrarchaeota archaeon]